MITYKWVLEERELNPPVIANMSSFIVYSSIINQVSRSWSMLSASKSNTQMHISRGFKVFSKQFLGNPIKGIKVDTCIWNLVVKVNRTSRMIPCYTCLSLALHPKQLASEASLYLPFCNFCSFGTQLLITGAYKQFWFYSRIKAHQQTYKETK